MDKEGRGLEEEAEGVGRGLEELEFEADGLRDGGGAGGEGGCKREGEHSVRICP